VHGEALHFMIMSPEGSSRRTVLRNSLMSVLARVAEVHWVPPENLQLDPDTAIVVDDQPLELFSEAV
jgi:hypothetical protein